MKPLISSNVIECPEYLHLIAAGTHTESFAIEFLCPINRVIETAQSLKYLK